MDFDRLCLKCMREGIENGVCIYCGTQAGFVQEPPFALPAGTILHGQYMAGGVLGCGGFGITYAAVDLRDGHRVAIKEYFPNGLGTRSMGETGVISLVDMEDFRYGLEQFLSEARIIYNCRGTPNIIQVEKLFEENNTAYYAMEYLEGQDLKHYLKERGGKLTYRETSELLEPIFDVLSQVHSKNIIHRDISPDNIYLCRDGTVKLLDFGAARAALQEKSKSLDVILKRGYAPVEQYYSHGRQGPWTDVYALGCTIYKCITGIVPPESPQRLQKDECIPPSELCDDIPGQASAALMKAMEVLYEARIQNAAEFKAALYGRTFMDGAGREGSYGGGDTGGIAQAELDSFAGGTAGGDGTVGTEPPHVTAPTSPGNMDQPGNMNHPGYTGGTQPGNMNQPGYINGTRPGTSKRVTVITSSQVSQEDKWTLLAKRFGAYVIDCLIVGFMAAAVGGFAEIDTLQSLYVLTFLLYFLYGFISEASYMRATAGKKIMKLQVFTSSGDNLPAGKAALRNLIKYAAILVSVGMPFYLAAALELADILCALLTKKGEPLHDLISGSRVAGPVHYRVSEQAAEVKVEAEKPQGIPVINCVSGHFSGQYFPLEGGKLILGRNAARCNVVFPQDAAGVSSVHCEVIYDSSTKSVIVKDLGSTYGTFAVEGRKLEAQQMAMLRIGDSFTIGDQNTFLVVIR